MTEYEKAEQDVAAAKVAERIAEWKAMEAKAAYYRYASEAMAASAEVMGSRIRRDNALASEFVEKANAALEAPAQPVHPEAELRSDPPASEEESRDQQLREQIDEDWASLDKDCEQLGYEAFGNGVAFEDNPHASHRNRQHWARGWCEAQRMVGEHSSDCSLHNLPAFEPLPCNCGRYDATLPTADDVRGILSDTSGLTLVAEFDQEVTRITNVDGRLIATLADETTVDVTDQFRNAAVAHVVEQDWTPTLTDAEITVADLDKLVSKVSPAERAEMESDAPEIPEEFTKWYGGGFVVFCKQYPARDGMLIEVLFRNGERCTGEPAGFAWDTAKELLASGWKHEDAVGGKITDTDDIIAYRILEAPAPEQDASVEIEPPVVETILGGAAEFIRQGAGLINEPPSAQIMGLYRNGEPGWVETNCPTSELGEIHVGYYRLGVMKDYWQRGVNDRSAGNNALPFKDGSLAAELWADGYSGRPYLRDKNGKPLPEPGPYDAAVEKGAITQDEADFLVSERERIAADEQASFFAEGMTADADKHAKHDGPFAWLRKREDA